MKMDWTYDEFLDKVAWNLTEMMPDGMEDVKIDKFHVEKLNGSYDGIRAMRSSNAGVCLNLTDLYNEVMSAESKEAGLDLLSHKLIELQEKVVNEIERAEIYARGIDFITDYQLAKRRLIPQLVNRDKPGLLDYPHTNIPNTDLSVIYRVEINDGSTAVKNGLFEKWGISLEQLNRDTFVNANLKHPITVKSMGETLNLPDTVEEDAMYVVSNPEGYMGAAALFYPHSMEKVAERVGGSFYVLPSSIHEMLIVPKSPETEIGFLQGLVRSVNDGMRRGENGLVNDVLSDSVYSYNAESKTFKREKESRGRDER